MNKQEIALLIGGFLIPLILSFMIIGDIIISFFIGLFGMVFMGFILYGINRSEEK